MNRFLKSILLITITVVIYKVARVIGGGFTVFTISSGWYRGLVKPVFSPPNWVLGPVWALLYFLIGVSLFLVIKKHPYKLEFVRMFFVGVGLFFCSAYFKYALVIYLELRNASQ